MPFYRYLSFAILALAVAGPAQAQFGFGGRGGDVELVDRFDRDGDGVLNREERDLARSRGGTGNGNGGGFGPGFPGTGRRSSAGEPAPGRALTPGDVQSFTDEPLYDLDVLRTLFIDFEYSDWESELEAFYNSDVEVPATVTVDGETYRDVGIHFRGNSSYRAVPTGFKRSLNLSFDQVHDDQRIGGYRTVNLLHGFGDPTFLRNVLYLKIANEYYPATKANYVRVVINGEDWGIYVNVQQFNSDFTREVYDTNEARWKISGSFNSRGGLEYLGESAASYRSQYSIKNKDRPENWEALIELTRVLNQTPPDELVAALEPLLDIDEALRFLAVDIALLNSDGYWVRNSDYAVYRDEDGRFHITAYDANEAMSASEGGPGRRFGGFGGRGGRGAGGGGVSVSPLAAADDPSKALHYRLLAVPELKSRYLEHVRDIAENWLDWETLEPLARRYQGLIGDVVAEDTRKLYSTDAFTRGVTEDASSTGGGRGPGSAPSMSLKSFVEQRQAYLLNWLDDNAGAAVP